MSYPDFTQNNNQMMMQQQMQPQMYNQIPLYPWQYASAQANRTVFPTQVQNAHTQPQMPSQQACRLTGRFVSNPEEIAVNEVAMDGSVSVFPANDMSCIYAKQWTANGTINTVKYVPLIEEPSGNGVQNATQSHFDYSPLIERFDRLEQLLTPQKPNSRAKKGESENE